MSLPQAIEELRQRPIPHQERVRKERNGARAWPIDATDSHISEHLVVMPFRGAPQYAQSFNPPYYEQIPGSVSRLYARSSVVEKLSQLEAYLNRYGLELYIYDAWRTQATQSYCRDVWFRGYLKKTEPLWSEEKIREEIGRYWAMGPQTETEIDPLSPPPHATGAAIDLTIAGVGGEPLWMGTIFDDVSVAAHTDYLEQYPSPERSFTYEEGLKNRRLLYWLMTGAGFEVNPNEWWHVSWGDQMWAKIQSYRTGTHIKAFYSNIVPDDWNSRSGL